MAGISNKGCAQRKGDPMNEHVSFEDRVASVELRLAREPRHRLALYRLLAFCQEPRSLEEVDAEVRGYPELAASRYSSRTLLSWLLEPGAVMSLGGEEPGGADEEPDRDADGEGKGEPLFLASPVGERVLDDYRASRPLERLMDRYPQYEEAFRQVLRACRQPLASKEVNRLFDGDPVLEESGKIYPSFFVDKLEGAGGLVYKGGWQTTDEGAALLAGEEADTKKEEGLFYEHLR